MNLTPDKALLVVGFHRSGTSLCMRSLEALGLPIKVSQHPQFTTQSEETQALNPHGFYEGPWTTKGLTTSRQELGGFVVKIMASVALPTITDYSQVAGVILCCRNPRDQLLSAANMHYPMKRQPGRWLHAFGRYASWLLQSDVPHILVDFEDWSTDINANKLISFVAPNKNKELVTALFETSLVRNSINLDWEPLEQRIGLRCDEFYQLLRAGDTEGIALAYANFQQEALDSQARAKTRWVDLPPSLIQSVEYRELFHGTWVSTNSEEQTTLNAREVTGKPCTRAALRKKHLEGVKFPQKYCEHYSLSLETESVLIYNGSYPLTVVQPKVECSFCEKAVSMMQCYHCWHDCKRLGCEPSISQAFGEAAV